MIRNRLFVLVASAATVGTSMLVACGDAEPRAVSGDVSDAAEESDGSFPPVDHDAGMLDADAARSTPDYDASDEPIVCTTTPCATQLVAGWGYFCALLSDGTVRCWGSDDLGSLGRGETDGVGAEGSRPMPVVGITNATQISASPMGYSTCARNAEGRVQCWGANTFGQLGLQVSPALVDEAAHPTPADVALTTEIARVDVGPKSVCALGTNGNVYCWGSNDRGLLARPEAGTSDSSDYYGPGLADVRNYDVTRIVAGSESVFGLTRDRQLLGWGMVTGRDSSLVFGAPSPLPTLSDVTSVATSGFFHCAIAGGNVYCWGWNLFGQLGTGFPGDERLPALARIVTDGGVFPQQLALAMTRSCVRMTDGTVQCCGDDPLMLGRGDAGTLTSVYELATVLEEHAVQVAMNDGYGATTCALVQGGKIMCWGGNTVGKLGQGTTDWDAHPIPVAVVLE